MSSRHARPEPDHNRENLQLRAHEEAVTDLLAVFGDASDDAIAWDHAVAGGDGAALTGMVPSS
jgi:hypothetical protein